ncbi:MAG: ATP-binding protein [Thermoanaerobaculaceae bacterium]|nr:ATP-binding protein [Thermoanaerobaculaceae bacterium]TAM53591.1 MAG: response regulator [Acidobacteriota bacterium]
MTAATPKPSPNTEPSPAAGGTPPRSVEPLPGNDARRRARAADLRAFHDELRRNNLRMVFWAATAFIPAYLTWTVFDFVLAPAHWTYFLALRLAAVVLNVAVAITAHRPAFRRYAWEALWALAFFFGAFIAPMLPLAGDHFAAYVMGFSVVILGVGLLPAWPPSWSLTNIAANLAAAAGAFAVWPTSVPLREILGSAFFVLTAAGISLAAAYFKYNLARSDYFNRAELAEVARLEAEARRGLDAARADLQRALDQLKDLDRLKSKFFANVSHELRTPLTLILAPVEELAATTTDPERMQYLRVIRRNAYRLLRLIDDLLDLSRLDAGGLRLNLADVDIRALAATVHENSMPAALARSITFTLAAEPSPRRIFADAHRLEIVLTNLVGNALKFTPHGGAIEIRVEDLADGVQVVVRDTGPGIPPDALPRVFERFFQVSGTEQRRHGGVGIGLALAKELVELHGGTIEATSTLGAGTTFTVFLPFGKDHIRPETIERRESAVQLPHGRRRAEDPSGVTPALGNGPTDTPAAAGPELSAGARRARIVLAEDNVELQQFIRGLLQAEFDLYTADDGDEAWVVINRERPDLVISDVMMPGRSGTRLCNDIKTDPALAATPVILLTARVGSEATLEGYAHGADDFVAKPFHPRVLLARVRAQLKLRALGLQLAEREKLAVVGTLAAGILHEVRNPVNSILNAARVLAGGIAAPDLAAKLLAVIADGAQRIQGITSALESHARPAESGSTALCDVHEGLDATLLLLEHRMAGVPVHRDFAATARAAAPPGPLNQVFLNIIDNALRSGAKNVYVTTASDARTVTVRIGDDGPGVPVEVVQRIFDPFFTTRKVGNGTGLGLYLSRKIVEDCGGRIRYQGRRGGGAEFVVEIPAANAPPAPAAPVASGVG